MKLRLVIVASLVTAIGGGTVAAYAAPNNDHQVCVVVSNANNDYRSGQYVCVDAPGS